MSLSGSTVAVTGATGFLGSHAALHLAEQGASVRAVARSVEKGAWLRDHGISLVHGDLTDTDSLAAAFAGVDAVVSTAALSTRERASWDDFYLANAVGTENLLQACVAAGVGRLVLVSTVGVYRTQLGRVMDETTPVLQREGDRVGWARLTTNWRYALTKAIGERRAWEIAAEAGIALTVLRPGPIYGPRDVKLTRTYARVMQRRVLPTPTARLPHVHAGDVAVAMAGALRNAASAGRAYNVTGRSVSFHEVLSTWKALAGGGPVLVPVPIPLWVDFDDSAAERDLGFSSRSLEEGIRSVLEALNHPV